MLILGAFGCGAFKNPPELVAKAFKTVISENHYDECFRKIVFAIKSSNNDDPFEPCQNLMAFEFEFDGISAEANKLRFSDSYSLEQAFGIVTLPSGRVLTGGKEFNPYFEWQKSNEFHGKQFSILGDSISTLEGYNQQGYNLFFTGEICQKSGVSDMNDTWWGQVIIIDDRGQDTSALEKNISVLNDLYSEFNIRVSHGVPEENGTEKPKKKKGLFAKLFGK